MNKFLLSICCCLLLLQANAQENGFKFGQVTFAELTMKSYERDSSASAVVLNEFAEARIDREKDYNLIFEYHVKIKIFNSKAFNQANISVPIYKQASKIEKVYRVEASTFNLADNKIQESKLNTKEVYTENLSKFYDLIKFTLPNIKEGSVIDIKYTLESPFIFNFRSWEFQSDIPKIHSEYWPRIPANYLYNITLKGFQALSKNESESIKDCLITGNGSKADCALYKYAMDHVPAFIEEDFMTAKSNFVSSINFELSEIRHFDGRVDKITKQWKDIDQELRNDAKFGAQLRKGKDTFKDALDPIIATEKDSLQQAKKVYHIIKSWYKWNNVYGKYSEFGIKKASDNRTGNIGDINLSLIAALQYAGFNAEPVLLSTRENGLPITVHPVMSDFNYVIGRLEIGKKVYLLDATDANLCFGMLPMRCLNGQGRVMSTKTASYWMDIKPAEKLKQVTILDLKLQKDGNFKGKITLTSTGYKALDARKEIRSFQTKEEYVKNLSSKWHSIQILNHTISNLDSLEGALTQTFEIEMEGFDNLNKNMLYMDPFFVDKWEKNPFTAKERLYPVDLGAPIETHVIVNLEYPENFQAIDLPKPVALGLPNNGGRFIYNIQNTGNRISLNNIISLNKTLYSSQEYHYMKELFNTIVQMHQTNLIFKQKI